MFINIDRKITKSKSYYFIFACLILALYSHHLFGNFMGPNEYTYLLLGRSVWEGNLPLIDHWDSRGPLVFYFFAINFFFENFIIAEKLSVMLSLFISSIVFFKTSLRFTNLFGAFFSTIGLIIFCSISTINYVQVEHYTLPFMCIFLHFIFLSYKNLGNKSKNAFLAGFAISIATLIRPNLGLVALAGGVIFLLSKKKKLFNFIMYVFGGFLPLILLIYQYGHNVENIKLLWDATITAHLNLHGGRPIYIGLFQFLDRFINNGSWSILIIVALIIVLHKILKKKFKDDCLFIFILFFIIFLSFILSRKFNDHYLIPMFPCLLIICFSVFNQSFFNKKYYVFFYFLLIFPQALLSNFNQKLLLIFKPQNEQEILASLLKDKIKNTDNIFSTEVGLYLYLNKTNLLRVVDPTHFSREYNYASVFGNQDMKFSNEFEKVLKKETDFLIIRKEFYKENFFKDIKNLIKKKYYLYKFYDEAEIKNYKKNIKKYIDGIDVYKLRK